METGEVSISRVRQTVTYPANFTLIAATNPCPCGYFGSSDHYCTCSPNEIRKYQQKASGPLLDRFDFQLYLQSVHLAHQETSEDSNTIRQRVSYARNRQKERYQPLFLNSTSTIRSTAPTLWHHQTTAQSTSHHLLSRKME